MSIRIEWFMANDADVDLVLPGEPLHDEGDLDDDAVGLAIGNPLEDNWTIITGTPAQLSNLAERILIAVDALPRTVGGAA